MTWRTRFLCGTLLTLAACGSAAGGLSGYGAADTSLTCASGLVWTRGTSESALMNPGYACRSCHLGNNFNGQNPGNAREPEKAYFFMGTAYSTQKEADLCAADAVPQGAVVEILDTNDVVQLTLSINEVGNFYSSSTTAKVPVPFKARVRANGKVNAMAASQTDGDCNSCHTAGGLNGAPGRITWPQ